VRVTPRSNLRKVAFLVCTALHKGGIEAVLTGGSAATVYAPRAYQSRDLDFIVTFRARESDARKILASLGYREVRDHYEHSDNPLILEFPQGPLAVGGELIREWDTLRERGMLLHIIKPTDSCRDRLAGFLFWNDRGSLAQAVAVARAERHAVDIDVIRRWCRSEGKADAFREFERELAAAQ
jgi:hypothetical protein